MFAKKICPKNEKLYIFEKPLTMPFQICKKFCKILNNLNFNQEKLKMCKFPLTGCLQKAKFYQNLTSENGSKQRFVTGKSSHSGAQLNPIYGRFETPLKFIKFGFRLENIKL